MTKLPSTTTSFSVAVTVILISLCLPSPAHALGSGSTLAVSYGSATVCAVVAAQPTQRLLCYQGGTIRAVEPNISFSSISAGQSFFCGIRSGGYSLLCWDTNFSYNSNFVPKRIYYNDTVLLSSVSVGSNHVCATTVQGQINCWRGDVNISKNAPSGELQFKSLTSGIDFSCGILTNNKTVRCWGINSISNQIQTSFANRSMFSITAGGNHVCGIDSNGFVICYESGQLNFPLNSAAFEYSALSLGFNHGCAIRRLNGSVVCWGSQGEYSVNGIRGISFESIVSGSNFTCGLTTSNFSVICWGPGWPNVSNDSVSLGSRLLTMRRQRSGTSSKHADRAEEFLLAELAAATNNFSLENKIGAGSFGVVYKGKLPDGQEVAIKRGETAKTKKFQEKESAFDSELAFLSRLHHKHLVRLVGYCEEKDERLLVYDYMKNGALYDHLHDRNNVEKSNAARGIEYLHNYAVPPIIHRDIKSSNILLDAQWTARVSDFGLSMMGPESERDFRPMKAAGTVGYIDPEYYGLNVLTAKSDVYGLGVVLLELLTGKRAIFKDDESGGTPVSLVDFAVPAIMAGELVKILDRRVGPPEINEAEAVELVAYTAMHCVNLEGKERPTMADIVANLERALDICDHSHGSISSSGIVSIASD
ncbi:hypothetical protein CUMW_051860 [Citrus unshiu]|nr:hypothetical protein CUMW_051860 [Citrus unshiu]